MKEYIEIAGIIQDVAIEMMSEMMSDGVEQLCILTGAYYIGYVIAFRNDVSKVRIASFLARYYKNYDALTDIEIFDNTVFRYFIKMWNRDNKRFTESEIAELIEANKEDDVLSNFKFSYEIQKQ